MERLTYIGTGAAVGVLLAITQVSFARNVTVDNIVEIGDTPCLAMEPGCGYCPDGQRVGENSCLWGTKEQVWYGFPIPDKHDNPKFPSNYDESVLLINAAILVSLMSLVGLLAYEVKSRKV